MFNFWSLWPENEVLLRQALACRGGELLILIVSVHIMQIAMFIVGYVSDIVSDGREVNVIPLWEKMGKADAT